MKGVLIKKLFNEADDVVQVGQAIRDYWKLKVVMILRM